MFSAGIDFRGSAGTTREVRSASDPCIPRSSPLSRGPVPFKDGAKRPRTANRTRTRRSTSRVSLFPFTIPSLHLPSQLYGLGAWALLSCHLSIFIPSVTATIWAIIPKCNPLQPAAQQKRPCTPTGACRVGQNLIEFPFPNRARLVTQAPSPTRPLSRRLV